MAFVISLVKILLVFIHLIQQLIFSFFLDKNDGSYKGSHI